MSRKPFAVSQSGKVTQQHLVQWSGKTVISDAEGTSATLANGPRVSYALSVDFNSSNTDTPIVLPLPEGITAYRIHGIRISGATAAINSATCGVFTEPSATGIAIVASGTPVTITQTGPDLNNNLQSLTIVNQDIIAFGDTTLYFRVQTPEGSSAKANVSVAYELLDVTSKFSNIAPPPPPQLGSISSAGVFDSNGVLVRTLWSASAFDQRVNNPAAAWDGTLDNGSVAPTGNYTITVLTNNVSYVWDGVIGNSSADHNTISIGSIISGFSVFNRSYHSYGGLISDMAITAAGEMYFTTSVDERMNTAHVATTAAPQTSNGVIGQGFRSTIRNQNYTCTDGTNAYFACQDGSNPSNNFVWAVVCSTHAQITFSSGTSTSMSGLTVNAIAYSTTNQFILGIAVQKSGNLLFVSRIETVSPTNTYSIWVLNKTTGALLNDNLLGYYLQASIAVSPTDGSLWVAHVLKNAAASSTWDATTSSADVVLSGGLLTASNPTGTTDYIYSTGTGTKFYYEVLYNNLVFPYCNPIGVCDELNFNTTGFLGVDAFHSCGYAGDRGEVVLNSTEVAHIATYTTGDNIGVAYDAVNHLIWFRKNGGLWNNDILANQNPATGTGGISTGTMGSPCYAVMGFNQNTGNSSTAHFASSSWTYAAPAGFSQLAGVTYSPVITQLTSSVGGVLTPTGVAVTTGLSAIAPQESGNRLAISPDGTTLLVTDTGVDSNVKAFNTVDGSVKTAFGTSGAFGTPGGYTNSPAITNTKFLFNGFLGQGGNFGAFIAFVPADNSFWLSDPGNCRVIHFSSGNSPAYIEEIAYFPLFYSCGACYNDPTKIFGSYIEFKVDYTKPLQPGNGSWTRVNNWFRGAPGGFSNYQAFGLHPITGTNGRTYASLLSNWYELTPTGWRNTGVGNVGGQNVDRNFNMWSVPATGPGSSAALTINRFTGFDGSNNPIFTTDPTQIPSVPYVTSAVFPPLFPRLEVGNNAQDYTSILANGIIPVYNWHSFDDVATGAKSHFGGIDSTTGNIKFTTNPGCPGNQGGNVLSYPPAPYFQNGRNPGTGAGGSNGVADNGGGMSVYEPGTSDVFALYRGESWQSNQTYVWDHWHQSGLMVNRIGTAYGYFGAVFSGNANYRNPNFPPLNAANLDYWQTHQPFLPNPTDGFIGFPAFAGNVAWGGIGKVGSDYYLFTNDEWYHGGVHRWHVSNLSSIALANTTVSWNSSSYTPPPSNPYNFMAGLPYNTQNLPSGSGGWTRNPTSDNTAGGNHNVPWYRIYTNATVCDPHLNPDLLFEANLAGPVTATLSYSWTRVGSGNWTISGVIIWEGEGLTNTGVLNRALFLDILDNTGKILVRIENSDHFPTGDCLWVNNTSLRTPLDPTTNVWISYSSSPQPLSIHYDTGAGTMTVKYAEFTMTGVTVHDAGANIALPAQFLLTYQMASGFNDFLGINILSMQFADS